MLGSRFFVLRLMPFPGIPAGSELEKKIDRCVVSVMATGRDKDAAIAICRSSIASKDRSDAVTEANYRDAGPASTQICATCRFAEGSQCSLFDFRFDPEWICNEWLPDIERTRARLTELQTMNQKEQWMNEAKERIRLKRTNAEERAMFAKMGGSSGGGGGGGGGGKLWPKDPKTGKRKPDQQAVTEAYHEMRRAQQQFNSSVLAKDRSTAKKKLSDAIRKYQKIRSMSSEKDLTPQQPPSGSDKATFSVFKDATGQYRWLMVSSSAYQDRDGEIVSTKALENAVAEHDKTSERGPLRFWHIKDMDLGQADFGVLHGRMLLESGTFRTEEIGKAVAKSANSLGASIGFRHPLSEPIDGVYHNVSIFERSILPKTRASNIFTSLTVHKESKMNEDKLKALKELLGDDALTEQVLSQVKATEAQAQAQGFTYKSHDELSALSADEMLEYALERKEHEEAQAKQAETNEAETLKAIQAVEQRLDKIIGLLEAHDTAIKELQTAAQETKETKVEKDKFSEVDERLKQLEDEQPKALSRNNGYRASEQSQPVDEKPVTEKDRTAEAMKAVEENPQLAPFANVVKGMSPMVHPYWGGLSGAQQPGQGG